MKQNYFAALISVFLILLSDVIQAQDQQAKLLMDSLVAQDSTSALRIAPLVDSLNYRDPNGLSLLMIASKLGYTKICEILIEKGTMLDLQDNYGNTALIYATSFGNVEVVNLLISKGANLDLQDRNGKTAYIIAYQIGNTEIESLLKSKLDSEKPANIKNATQAKDETRYRNEMNVHKNISLWPFYIAAYTGGTICFVIGTIDLSKCNNYDVNSTEYQTYYDKGKAFGNAGYIFAAVGAILELIEYINNHNGSTRYRNACNYDKNKFKLDKMTFYANSYSAGIGLKFNF